MTRKNASSAGHISLGEMLELMRDKGPMMISELSKLTDICRGTLATRLHKAHRQDLVHISGWVEHKSNRCKELVALWAEGRGVDVDYPSIDGSDPDGYQPNYAKLHKEVAATIERARKWPADAFLRMVAQLQSFGSFGPSTA